MKIIYSAQFLHEYKNLQPPLRMRAEEREEIFRADPFDARLKTHKLEGRLSEFWAFSIDNRYRIIFEFLGNNRVMFHIIGDHSIYEKF